ncbi:cysteine synthase family protein [Zooshikella marina]|uniref:cysteine synthase family protein n=1 Tax=Zooshikella ganghwensis TaxID=202772 RepID=UPI001BAF875B|nr:cysteine synthase family protein [Zooshikella ganghwensis]MBU2707933.1 cysteine synthase family protein [Zooshikella ganghwensis]
MPFNNILDSLGNTSLIHINKINQFLNTNVLVKLEKENPGGSIKDRAATFIIEQAEKSGLLQPGGTIIESSSGNFAISLAMIGAIKGYRVMVLVDPKTTKTNIALMKAYGAEVIVVTEKDDTGSYHKTRIAKANQLARENAKSYRPDQCFNVLSSVAHYNSTAKEIYKQTQGKIDGVVCAVSTGGQIGGIAEYFKRYSPRCNIACVDAYGSAVFGGPSHAYKIPGVGLGWTPRNIRDVNKIDYVYRVSDQAAYTASRILCRNEGILVGVSSGAVLLAALKLSLQLKNKHPIIALLGDSGERYLDTLFDDEWLIKNNIDRDTSMVQLCSLLEKIDTPQQSPNIESNYNDTLIDLLNVPSTTVTRFEQIDESLLESA